MLMLVEFLKFLGFVMSSEEENGPLHVDYIPTTLAGIFFALQFMIFMYNFNFNGVPIITWIGWLLLIPGFLLISLSRLSPKNETSVNEGNGWKHTPAILKQSNYKLLRHPFLYGWLMLCVALAMISQYWLSIFCMGFQIPLIVFTVYNKVNSSENHDAQL